MTFDEKECSVDKPGYIGKLRANFFGTQYNLYDKGLNPEKTKDKFAMRKQYALIIFVI